MRPIVNVPTEDRVTDMGNMHKNLGKKSSGDYPVGQRDRQTHSTDTQTDRQTDRQTYSSQYFATAPAGELN